LIEDRECDLSFTDLDDTGETKTGLRIVVTGADVFSIGIDCDNRSTFSNQSLDKPSPEGRAIPDSNFIRFTNEAVERP
jgi:hypothetical protein